jgi:hypothetical protein
MVKFVDYATRFTVSTDMTLKLAAIALIYVLFEIILSGKKT